MMIVDLLFVPAGDEEYLAGQKKRLKIIGDDLSRAGIKNRTTQVRKASEIIDLVHGGKVTFVLSISDEIPDHAGTTRNVHDLLDAARIPYVGSASASLRLCRSKSSLKEAFIDAQVPTPEFFTVNRRSKSISLTTKLGKLNHYPYIVKPDSEGNSAGISKRSVCSGAAELRQKINSSLDIFNEVIVEQYMGFSDQFKEFTVALIGTPPNALILPARVQFKDPSVHKPITTEDKDQHRTLATPVKNTALYRKVADLAGRAFRAANVRDYARCDLVQGDDQFYVLEINGQPMIPDLWFEACCKSRNLSRKQYLYSILLSALARWNRSGQRLRIPHTLLSAIPQNVTRVLMPDSRLI